jgi:hypothetical protein
MTLTGLPWGKVRQIRFRTIPIDWGETSSPKFFFRCGGAVWCSLNGLAIGIAVH